MISGFHHVVIGVRDIRAGVAAYEALLGVGDTEVREHDGVATALIGAGNVSVELMAPVGDGDMARRLAAALDDGGEGLKSLVFEAADIGRVHQRCARVGLAPEDITERRSFRIASDRSHGARLFLMERNGETARAGGVTGLDHIVLRTPDPERAAALYGARLGLDMRLDREVMGRRLMFFRCGDAVVELVHDVNIADGRDRLWGLSWRVTNADAARARLAAAGLEVSEVRQGVKPGTRVFSVREGTAGVPTLMIEQAPL